VRRRQLCLCPADPPGGERERKGRDLHAAAVDLQPRQIIAQHGGDGIGHGQSFLRAAQGGERRERLSEEMPAAAARVEHRDLRGAPRPAGEGSRRRAPDIVLAHKAQITPSVSRKCAGRAQCRLVLRVTGGSARRAMPGRGLWAAGAFAVRAITQAAALELREQRIHVALLIVDAGIEPFEGGGREGVDRAALADPREIADAVAFLANQGARAATHELQVTPLAERWVP